MNKTDEVIKKIVKDISDMIRASNYPNKVNVNSENITSIIQNYLSELIDSKSSK